MIKKRIFSLTTIAAMTLSTMTIAGTHVVVAPTCLLKNITPPGITLTTQGSLHLLRVDDQGINELVNAKIQQKNPCGGFMDVTQDWAAFSKQAKLSPLAADIFLNHYLNPVAPPQSLYRIQYEKEVNTVLNQINPDNLWANLSNLSAFKDRYADSKNGVQAAQWIKHKVEHWAKQYQRDDVLVYTIGTGNYSQPSVIAKIGNLNDEGGVVISGHMDTLASYFGPKPGADDDGSGTVTTLEAARMIIASGMHFKHPIYFMWYAAEEEGLVGSGYVVSEFKSKKIPVDAVLHFDMTGYAYKNDTTLWLMKDYVNKSLTTYLEKLITTYVKEPFDYTQCGYACSDHASWTQKGYAASVATETAFEHVNPTLHTSQDTIDHLSLKHMADFAKLATAFAVELAEPTH